MHVLLRAHAHTCTALFRPATIALQTIQPHWDSFRLSLGPLRFHLSTHYPLSCWLNNTERKEEREGGRKGLSLRWLWIARIVASYYSRLRVDHRGPILHYKLGWLQRNEECWLWLRQAYRNNHMSVAKVLHQSIQVIVFFTTRFPVYLLKYLQTFVQSSLLCNWSHKVLHTLPYSSWSSWAVLNAKKNSITS